MQSIRCPNWCTAHCLGFFSSPCISKTSKNNSHNINNAWSRLVKLNVTLQVPISYWRCCSLFSFSENRMSVKGTRAYYPCAFIIAGRVGPGSIYKGRLLFEAAWQQHRRLEIDSSCVWRQAG